MKITRIIFLFSIVFSFQTCTNRNAIFGLSPSQSMSITGKGPGQDAAFNPYGNEKSIAMVKNLGKSTFHVRIQKAGVIVTDTALNSNELREFTLDLGYELYLDSTVKGKAKVTFKRFLLL